MITLQTPLEKILMFLAWLQIVVIIMLACVIGELNSRVGVLRDQCREAVLHRNQWKHEHDELFRTMQRFDPVILHAIHLSWSAGYEFGVAVELGLTNAAALEGCSSNVVVARYRAALHGLRGK